MSGIFSRKDVAERIADPLRNIPRLSEVEAGIDTLWRSVLQREGFGIIPKYDAVKTADVTAEIKNMLSYRVLTAFYERDEDAVRVRKAALADYASPHFITQSIAESILPSYTFVPKIVSNQALLYKDDATRQIDGAKAEDYQTVLTECQINRVMKSAMALAKLTNLISIRPVVRDGRMALDVLTPDRFRLLLADDNTRVEKWIYEAQGVIDGVPQWVFYVWTATEHYMLDTSGNRHAVGDNVDGVNPYGMIPAVFVQLTEGNSWFSGGALDAVESCIEHNYWKMLSLTDGTFTAMNIPVFLNCNLPANFRLSPRRPIVVDDVRQEQGANLPPDVKIVTGTPNMEAFEAQAKAVELRAMIRAGIPPTMLSEQSRETGLQGQDHRGCRVGAGRVRGRDDGPPLYNHAADGCRVSHRMAHDGFQR